MVFNKSTFVNTTGVTVNLVIGVAAGVITLAVTAASALGIVAVVCLGRAARSKIYQRCVIIGSYVYTFFYAVWIEYHGACMFIIHRELMQIGRDITEVTLLHPCMCLSFF